MTMSSEERKDLMKSIVERKMDDRTREAWAFFAGDRGDIEYLRLTLAESRKAESES